MAKTLPNGRGFWVWHLGDCCGGDAAALAAHCQAHGITWLAIKWLSVHGAQQLTANVVATLQTAGVDVFGWRYDLPGDAAGIAQAARAVAGTGARGYIIDAEIEWESAANPDAAARATVAALAAAGLPADFVVAHAPFDVIANHQAFPYTALGEGCDFVSPQAYWSEHGISEAASTARVLAQWSAYRQKHPQACKALVPSGYSVQPDLAGGKLPTPADMLHFEATCAAAGCAAVAFWRFDGTPDATWQALAGTAYPQAVAGTCADADAAAPGC